MNRLAQLQQFYEEDPNDPFTLYGLALEWSKHDAVKSIRLFQMLIAAKPDYLPAYYQLAHLLQITRLQAEAEAIVNQGIAVARQNKDYKTEAELRSLLND